MTTSVLLVEDNPDDEELTIRALRRNDLNQQILVARDGAEALEYLLGDGTLPGYDRPPRPAVVLLDLKLPKIDGLELLNRLRADPRTRYLPVVVLTSSQEESDLTNSYTRGANSYIVKPVEHEKFQAAVGQLGLYWLILNQQMPYGEADR